MTLGRRPRPDARWGWLWVARAGLLGALAASCGEVSRDSGPVADSGVDGASGSGPDGGHDASVDAATDGAVCPIDPPSYPTPCDAAGTSCTYSNADGCCGEAGTGTFACNGYWWSVESTTCMPPTADCPDAEPEAGSTCSNCAALGHPLGCSWLVCPQGELHNAMCSGGKWKLSITWDYLCPPPDAG